MDKFIIRGGTVLRGEVKVNGAKNSVLPIMAGAILSDEVSVIKNVPALRDVFTMIEILKSLGVKVDFSNSVLKIHPDGFKKHTAGYDLVSKMRASVCLLGPLLAKQGIAKVSLPGGCVIGARPIDLHIKGLKALGSDIKIEHGYVIAKQKTKLSGRRIYLGGQFGSSVLATGNIIMAAVLAKGTTVIENSACEPEVVDLCDFLVKMGAKIKGRQTPVLEIEGVKKLNGAEHTVIPDRIEAGTFMVASAITKGDVTIKNAKIEHLGALVDKLTESGVKIRKCSDNSINVRAEKVKLKPISVTTLPYPGFPTDMQAQIMAFMTVIDGISVVTEKIYPNRFMHVSEYARMGADIMLERPTAIIKGGAKLSGAPVMASDLRASAGLILLGLIARGDSQIQRIYHIDRGYEKIEQRFNGLGAKIRRVKDNEC